MIDRLLDFILSIWSQLIPFFIVTESNEGVLLRLGKFKKIVVPGFYWKIPFADYVMTHHVVWQTMNLHPQSLTTLDNKGVVLKGIIKFRISDIQTFLLEVWDSTDAIADMCMGIIRDEVQNHNWKDILGEADKDSKFDKVISRKAKAEAKRWGIEIDTITMIDVCEITSIRLFNETKNHIFE